MSSILRIINNLYTLNILRKDNNYMSNFYTYNNEYRIEMIREYIELFVNTEIPYQYKCIIKIYNNLNIELFNITITEIDILSILDSVYQFLEFNQNEISIPITISNTMNNIIFHFIKDENSNNHILIITENNIQRIRILFNNDIESHSLDHFLELIYFTFLIDIDNYNPDILQYYDYYQ